LRRGWYWGSEALKERLLKLKAGRPPAKCRDYRLSLQERDFGEAGAERIVIEGLAKAGLADGDLAKLKGSDPRKVRIAARVWRETCVGQGWIAARLSMGGAGNVSQQLWRWRRDQTGRQSEPGKRRGIIREKYSIDPFPALSLTVPPNCSPVVSGPPRGKTRRRKGLLGGRLPRLLGRVLPDKRPRHFGDLTVVVGHLEVAAEPGIHLDPHR